MARCIFFFSGILVIQSNANESRQKMQSTKEQCVCSLSERERERESEGESVTGNLEMGHRSNACCCWLARMRERRGLAHDGRAAKKKTKRERVGWGAHRHADHCVTIAHAPKKEKEPLRRSYF